VDYYSQASLDINNNAGPALATLTISEAGCDANLNSGTYFNDPTGSDPKQFRISNTMIQYIDCAGAVAKAKPGQPVVIVMSWFSVTDGQIISHLKTAKANGANVRFLINSHATKAASSSVSYWKQIYKALNGVDWPRNETPVGPGPDVNQRWAAADDVDKATGSWALYCDHGCLTPPCTDPVTLANLCKDFPADSEAEYPAMHSKFFAIMFPGYSDNLGVQKQTTVVGIGSSNPTLEQAVRGWNNLRVVVERNNVWSANPLFSSINRYFHDLSGQALPAPAGGTPDRSTVNYLGVDGGLGTVGATTFTAFPRSGTGGSTDNITQMLNNVKCIYTDSKGRLKRTQIYVNMFVFTRNSPAMKLWRLAFNPKNDKTTQGGCQIHIIYTDMDSAIRSVTPGTYGKWLTKKGYNVSYGAADCLSAPGTQNGHWRSMLGVSRQVKQDANNRPIYKIVKGKKKLQYQKVFVCNRGTLQGLMPTINTWNKNLCWLYHTSNVTGGSINACVSTPLKLTTLDPADNRAKLEYYPDGRGRYSYSHQKYLLISGMYKGTIQQVTVAGTPNFTNPGLRWNDEIMTITSGNSATSKATYSAYLANFNAMRTYITNRRLPAFNICRQLGTCKN
jgi:phosphatidylserine/phosphatidylglycerophosphate/cardiolipin synthase-like enzyme